MFRALEASPREASSATLARPLSLTLSPLRGARANSCDDSGAAVQSSASVFLGALVRHRGRGRGPVCGPRRSRKRCPVRERVKAHDSDYVSVYDDDQVHVHDHVQVIIGVPVSRIAVPRAPLNCSIVTLPWVSVGNWARQNAAACVSWRRSRMNASFRESLRNWTTIFVAGAAERSTPSTCPRPSTIFTRVRLVISSQSTLRRISRSS